MYFLKLIILFQFSILFINCFTNNVNDYEYSDTDSDDDYEENLNNDLLNKTFIDINNNNNISDLLDRLSEFDRISLLQKSIFHSLLPVKDRIEAKFQEFIQTLEIPVDCIESFARIMDGMKKAELWSFKFFDSMGKIPSAVTEGVSSFFGDYNQCLSIESRANNHSKQFYGKYCLASPQIPIPTYEELENNITISILDNKTNILINKLIKKKINTIKLFMANNFYIKKATFFRYGFCIPSNCEAKDLEKAINKVFQPILKIPIGIGPECSVKSNKLNLNKYQMFSAIVFATLIMAVIISTTIEVLFTNSSETTRETQSSKAKSNNCINVLTIFSIKRNTKNLFSQTKRDKYQCIHTLLFIFIIWIHIGRYYISPLTINLVGVKKIFSSFILDMLSHPKYFWVRTPFPLGTLFIFGGLYISLDFFSKKQSFSLKKYVNFAIEKWIRFNALCIGSILIIFILSATGSGPIWEFGSEFFAESCELNYWQNILFVNSFYLKQICNPSSIYVTTILNLQIISPMLMIIMNFRPKLGIILNIFLIIFGAFAAVLPRLLGLSIAPFEVADMHSVEEVKRSLIRYNIGPEQCITPFMAGILVGYIIAKRDNFQKISKNVFMKVSLWLIFITMSTTAIVWGENFKDVNITPNKLDLLLWFSTGKILWSIGCGSLLVVLAFSEKGYLTRILSMKMFRPITRLNFTFLLLHTILMYYRLFVIDDNKELTQSYYIQCIIVDTLLTYIMAYILFILIECPVSNILNLFRKSDQTTDQNSNYVQSLELKRLNLRSKDEIEHKYSFPDN